MNQGAQITTMVLAISLALAGVYDVYAGLKWGPTATVTFIIREWSREYPIIPFAVGALVGHLFWH